MKHLNLTFSGMDGNDMVIDTGTVTDLCQDGIGICTQRPLKPGMELALFVNSPDDEDHICIPEARVAWVSGDQFGVSLRTIKSDDHERLRLMFQSAGCQPLRVL